MLLIDQTLIGVVDHNTHRATLTAKEIKGLSYNLKAVSDANYAILSTEAYCKHSSVEAQQKTLKQLYTNVAGAAAGLGCNERVVRLSEAQLKELLKIYQARPLLNIKNDNSEGVKIPISDFSMCNDIVYLGPIAYTYLVQNHADLAAQFKKY